MQRYPLVFLAALFGVGIGFAHAEDAGEKSNAHVQATTVTQGYPSMNSPYAGVNSLPGPGETKTSFTSTLYLGYGLFPGGAIFVNPEVTAGEGIGLTRGIAGFTNGEIYRVDTSSAKLYLSRIYFQHVIGFGGEQENIEDDKNQLAGKVDVRRITLIGGKFSLNDFFDDNLYSHDPRTQFLNWGLMDDTAWDYAADTRGYTWGFFTELNEPAWAARFAFVVEPVEANALQLDPHFLNAYGANWEFEYRYGIQARHQTHPGKLRLLTYLNRAHMGSYSETLANPAYGKDITLTRDYRFKYGFGLNMEQEISSVVGAFSRIGWNNGSTETWNFTEVDRTASLGLSIKGSPWKREDDSFGIAGIINGLSSEHANYLGAGGYGFIIGDGRLNYAPEQIFEAYYSARIVRCFYATADFQYVNHPAYNADRGPANMISGRLHFEI